MSLSVLGPSWGWLSLDTVLHCERSGEWLTGSIAAALPSGGRGRCGNAVSPLKLRSTVERKRAEGMKRSPVKETVFGLFE